ncbi:hypothetical protein A4A49_60490 [Nicotiana attenuata]|uniref:SWIM-type domain-containing protein n=1 Tax=Nicotiana attenuata TaxID=49451 RepID=A0A314L041_NICAT|nr:hypothetical protein A4A49_60490 [Nicotiana attenuata]
MASTLVNLQIHHSGNFVSDPDLSEPILVEDITELDPTIQTDGHDSGLNARAVVSPPNYDINRTENDKNKGKGADINEEIEESDERKARHKSLITMLEEIRIKCMERMNSMREFSEKWVGDISPMAMEILEENAQRAAKCEVKFNGETGYEIQDGPYKHVVDFRICSCTCRSWQLKGIPCAHAITAMHYKNYEVEPYVDHWYRKDTYLKAYSRFIQPLTSMNLWPKSTLPAIEPPVITAMPGKPKEKRRKAADEPKKKFGKGTRIGRQMRRSLCKTLGHNKKGCPSARNQGGKAGTSSVGGGPKRKTNEPRRGGANAGSKRPKTVGYSVLFDSSGTVIQRSGTTDRVVHNPSTLISSAPTNIELRFKPPGLKWNGRAAATQRQLQEQSYRRAKSATTTQATPVTQSTPSSQATTDIN